MLGMTDDGRVEVMVEYAVGCPRCDSTGGTYDITHYGHPPAERQILCRACGATWSEPREREEDVMNFGESQNRRKTC